MSDRREQYQEAFGAFVRGDLEVAVSRYEALVAQAPDFALAFQGLAEAHARLGQLDDAIAAMVEKLTSSGVVSAAGNRRAFRAGEEPLDTFRRYMAIYAREQADCHLSPALIANLERNWNNR